jgi:hypothetical protein
MAKPRHEALFEAVNSVRGYLLAELYEDIILPMCKELIISSSLRSKAAKFRKTLQCRTNWVDNVASLRAGTSYLDRFEGGRR